MSIYLRKRTAGVAPGVEWAHAGDVREVPDEVAQELLAHPGGEFTVVDPPAIVSPPVEAKATRARREVTEATPITLGGTAVTVPSITSKK